MRRCHPFPISRGSSPVPGDGEGVAVPPPPRCAGFLSPAFSAGFFLRGVVSLIAGVLAILCFAGVAATVLCALGFLAYEAYHVFLLLLPPDAALLVVALVLLLPGVLMSLAYRSVLKEEEEKANRSEAPVNGGKVMPRPYWLKVPTVGAGLIGGFAVLALPFCSREVADWLCLVLVAVMAPAVAAVWYDTWNAIRYGASYGPDCSPEDDVDEEF
ncbi:hypothetical protein [Ammonifex thiophilus]|uniref:Uncharacterized protein n=1 Tax=Ammonifex thiophilus TaxID=444093 RepID=A0A3D8P362_9THEO|nr:hypothetical protein [Ammonifex thiophilus]RDV81235.1 hypothetical protein DXX99_09635 [Ammonifex thiophilus]